MKTKIAPEARALMLAVILGCIVMAYVDAILRPEYVVKSTIKIITFVGISLSLIKIIPNLNYKTLFAVNKKGVPVTVALSGAIFSVILLSYFLLGSFFDLTAITESLTESMAITADNFIFVSVYIAIVNSFLEEFFFRGVAFLKLRDHAPKWVAHAFSSIVFSLYHVAMMIWWFDIALFALMVLALIIGGLIFNVLSDMYDNIYLSWMVHMFANIAINIVGFHLFGVIG